MTESAVEEIHAMKRRAGRTADRHDTRVAGERPGANVSASHVPFFSFGSLFRSGAVIAGIIVLACWWDERPASKTDNLLGRHPGKVLALAFSPDGRWLASGGYDSPVLIWDMTLRRIGRDLVGSPSDTFGLAFSPDGTILAAAGGDGTVRIWNSSSWSVGHVLHANARGVRSLAFSPDGKHLATGGADRRVLVWDTATWHERTVWQGHGESVRFVGFSPDGRRLAAACADGTVMTWDVDGSNLVTGRVLQGRTRPVTGLAFALDSQSLAKTPLMEPLALWDLPSGEQRAMLAKPQYAVLSVAFSPDGRTLVGGTIEGGIELWDIASRELRSVLRGHSEPVWALAFSPDGRTLVSGGYDATLRVWETRPQQASVR